MLTRLRDIMDRRGENGQVPELDGFRVVLVFLVSWYHIWQQSWLTPHIGSLSLDFLVRAGYLPVDGTILLSGFLLFLPHARAMLDGGPVPSVRTFYRRRLMRIVPSFYFITLVMLFAVAIPQGSYRSAYAMWRDILTHLTFTFPFNYQTYHATPLGGASWTLAVEVHMYLLFPLIARFARKRPAGTIGVMLAVAAYFRLYILWSTCDDLSMVLNQMISFLDVYAIGMAAALLYVRLKQWYRQEKQKLVVFELPATALLALCIWLFLWLMRRQAGTSGEGLESLQAGQLIRRAPLALAFAGIMVSLPFSLAPIRALFGNPVTHFLAGVSMNYYLVHQQVAVQLKRLHIPASVSETPNVDG